MKEIDKFNRKWIIKTAVPIVEDYAGKITIRGLHYQLVNRGMFNTIQHYRRVVGAMTQARWDGLIAFDAIIDHDRETIGRTAYEETDVDSEVEESMDTIRYLLDAYNKNRWENQEYYVEVFIEKKALQGIFTKPCNELDVALNPCKGYASLTFIHDAYKRFKKAEREGKQLVILYFGDYDPSGEDIPRSLVENLGRMGVDVELDRITLNKDQVIKWKLPPAPAKKGDSRTRNWDGLGQVELDAVDPDKLVEMVQDAVGKYFNTDLHDKLVEQEREERVEYRKKIGAEIREYLDNE